MFISSLWGQTSTVDLFFLLQKLMVPDTLYLLGIGDNFFSVLIKDRVCYIFNF